MQVLLQNLQGPANHDGGGLAIGPDGKLYVGVGDTGCNSGVPPGGSITNYIGTCLTTANGKVLRINVDGTIPSDNPLAAAGTTVPACNGSCGDDPNPASLTGAPRTEIWSWGFRNPFRFSFDPQTGNLWVGDVGEVTYEEVNLVVKGQHYGWPWREGAFGYPGTTCDNLGPNGVGADCVEPKYFCAHGGGGSGIDGSCQSITGGVFLDTPGLAGRVPGAILVRRQRQRERLDSDSQRRPGWLRRQPPHRDRHRFRDTRSVPGRPRWIPLHRPARASGANRPHLAQGRPPAGRRATRRRTARCRTARRRPAGCWTAGCRASRRGNAIRCRADRLRRRHPAGGPRRRNTLPGTGGVPQLPFQRRGERHRPLHALRHLGVDHDGQRHPGPAVPGRAQRRQPGRAGHRSVVPALPLAALVRPGPCGLGEDQRARRHRQGGGQLRGLPPHPDLGGTGQATPV